MSRTSRTLRASASVLVVVLAACGDSPAEPTVATGLAFDVQPGNAVAGAAIAPHVRVRVVDASGGTSTGPATVTLTLAHANGTSLLGTTSVAAINGVATFRGLRIEKAGAGYVLNASSGALPPATSAPFDITHAAPAKLRFVDQPAEATAGKPLSPAVTVEITDAYDNRASAATDPVTLVGTSTGPGAVIGTSTVAAVSGLATFGNIALTRAASYTLKASAPGLADATSAPFVVQLATTARFCPADVAAGASFASFPDALAALATDGTIVLCDGVHDFNTAVINKPLTIAPEHDGMVTVTNATGSFAFYVTGVSSGTVRITGLKFDVAQNDVAVIATGIYDQVIVESSTFRGTDGAVAAVYASTPSGPATAPLVVARNNAATGFRDAFLANTGARMHVIDNRIDASTSNAINLGNGSSGIIQRNRITGCGTNACIWAVPLAAGPVEVLDNDIENDISRNTLRGIRTQGNVNVRRNRIIGTGGTHVLSPINPTTFAFRSGAIEILGGEGITPVVEGNEISNAAWGIQLLNASTGSTHRNNRIKKVGWGFGIGTHSSADVFERNDISEFGVPVGVSVGAPPPVASFRCNWWGGQIGPISGRVDRFTIGFAVLQPFSRVPIAGKPEVPCDPGGAWTPARFCPEANATRDGWATFRDALLAAGAGGTILVCAGTFTFFTTLVDVPITLAAEHPHAAIFKLGAGHHGDIFHFNIMNGSSGTTIVRDLTFDLDLHQDAMRFGTGVGSPTQGRYDQVLIENNRFIHKGPPGVGLAIQATDIPTAKVVVRGNLFVGGLSGLITEGATNVEVIGNTFRDQPVSGFSRYGSIDFDNGGGPYVARNNTFTNCPHACIHVGEAISAEITDNVMETSATAATKAGIDLIASSAIIARNIIRGPPTVANRQLEESYAFRWAGILVQLLDTKVTINNNSVLNARYGIYANNAERTTGADNVLTLTVVPVVGSGAVSLQRNDFIDYLVPLFDGLPAGALTCNYWGEESGPKTSTPLTPEQSAVVTPFSKVPIARRPAVVCP